MSAEDIVSGFARYMGTDGPDDPLGICAVRADWGAVCPSAPGHPGQHDWGNAPTGTAPELPGEDGTVPAVPGPQEPSPGVALRTIIEYVLDAAQDLESNATIGQMLDDIEERMADAGLVARYAWQVMADEETIEVLADRIDALTRINIDHEPTRISAAGHTKIAEIQKDAARRRLALKGEATFDSPAGAGHEVEADRG